MNVNEEQVSYFSAGYSQQEYGTISPLPRTGRMAIHLYTIRSSPNILYDDIFLACNAAELPRAYILAHCYIFDAGAYHRDITAHSHFHMAHYHHQLAFPTHIIFAIYNTTIVHDTRLANAFQFSIIAFFC